MKEPWAFIRLDVICKDLVYLQRYKEIPINHLFESEFMIVLAQGEKTGGNDYTLLRNCEWNEKQKHKKQPWGNVECFAFDGVTVRFAPLETSFHAANHTIPPPPSYEGLPLCPKDKNRSPFHGEKPLMIT